MAKKRNMSISATDRILKLYTLLLFSGKRHFLTDIAKQFDCSKATITRMMEKIESSGVAEISSDFEDSQRWYQLKNLPGTPYIGLTEEEVEKLALCRDLLERLLPDPLAGTISTSIAKIATLMPERERRADAMTPRAKRIVWGRVDNNQGLNHFECLRKAIAAQTICEVTYRDVEYRFSDRKPDPATYLFLPVRVTCEDDTLNIEGWKVKKDHALKADHPMTLELQRIVSCRDTTEQFANCPALPEHEGAFGMVGFKAFPSRVVFAEEYASYIRERIWSDQQEIIDLPDNEVELRFLAADEGQLIRWVLSFGTGAELLEPEHLREWIAEEVEDLADRYADE